MNFQSGPFHHDEPAEGDVIVFHLDIRHGTESVVLNHFEQDGWGEEETREFPGLKPGEAFLIDVKVTADAYAIRINGIDIGEFKHRVPVDGVTHLFVFHDVTVNSVSLNDQKLQAID